jgi:hypothetical protein
MKIIGIVSESRFDRRKYICEVSHSEIEKFLNLYYDKLERLSAGDTVDLGTGYDFHDDIKTALETTKKFIKDNQKTVNAIMNGLTVVANKKKK